MFWEPGLGDSDSCFPPKNVVTLELGIALHQK